MVGTCIIMNNLVQMGPMSCSALEAKIQCLGEAVNSALTSSEIYCLAGIYFVCVRKKVIISAEFGGNQYHGILPCK